jgi:hypothetical protein
LRQSKTEAEREIADLDAALGEARERLRPSYAGIWVTTFD